MDRSDLELINRIAVENSELRRLWEEHLAFEKQIDELGRKSFLTVSEEMELRDIKKRKLAGRDRIEQILAAYR